MEIDKNFNYVLEILVTDSRGDPESGLSVTYEIVNSTNDVVVDSGSLNDLSNGVYKNSFQFTNLGQFRILYHTPKGFTDKIETVIVSEKTATSDILARVLGLVQGNQRIFDQQYDTNGDLTFAKIRLYDNASDTNNDVNHFAEYHVTITYNNRLVDTYKSVQVL